MRIKDIKIGQRLGGAFTLILLFLAAITGIGLSGIGKTFHLTTQMYEDSLVPLSHLGNMEYLVMRNRVLVMDMILQNNPENSARRAAEIAKNAGKADAAWAAYEAAHQTADEEVLVKAFGAARDAYLKQGLMPAREAMLAGNQELAASLYVNQMSKLAPPVFESLQTLRDAKVKLAADEMAQAKAINNSVRLLVLAAAAVAIALGGFLAWIITRSITQPLARAVRVAQTVASGDLTSHVQTDRADEAGQLLEALEDMNGKLQSLVSQVRSGTDSIAVGSGEIAKGNLDLSARTEQQAGSLEETASSMEELTSTVKQNADNARQANVLAATASDVAVKGGAVVAQVVRTMDEINQASRKIVDIIAVIDGIAFQTNILALNAAVEAARAGEQGRGFAVVATEVRNLAQRSASAAKEIKVLIDASVSKVDAGSRLVNEAGDTMEEIVNSVRRVTDIMGEISSASVEQEAGIGQINQAITEMDNVTQQNAALVEQSAAAAGALQEQADSLAQLVSTFKLDASGSQPKAARPAAPPAARQATTRAAARKLSPPPRQEPPRQMAAAAEEEWEQF